MIEFIVIENKNKVLPSYTAEYNKDRGIPYRPCVDSLRRQGKELGVKVDIKILPLNDIPSKTSSVLVGVLCENNLIPDDYLGRILACNNLYRSAYGFLGDHISVGKNANFYHLRENNSFLKGIHIQDKQEMIPLMYGTIFNGFHYNAMGGIVAFPDSILTNKIIPSTLWVDRLSILEYVNIEDKDLLEWCHELGYFYKRNYEDDPLMLTLQHELKISMRHYYNLGNYKRHMDEVKPI